VNKPNVVPVSVAEPPAGLGEPSRRLWCGLAGDLVVLGRASEGALQVLSDALRLAERADALAGEGVTVDGSQGQRRPHPGLALERQLRSDVEAKLRNLGLVDISYAYRVGADGRLREKSSPIP